MKPREWVEVPRAKVRVSKGRVGMVAVGYLPAPNGPVPIVGAGARRRDAIATLVAGLRALSRDPALARSLGLRTVALPPDVTTGEARALGRLVRKAQRGDAPARAQLARLHELHDQGGNARASALWGVASAQRGEGGIRRAAHYAPHVAAQMGTERRPEPPPPPVAPWTGYAPPAYQAQAYEPPQPAAPTFRPPMLTLGVFPPSIGLALPPGVVGARYDAGTSALLASLSGPRQVRGALSWGA